MRLDTIKSKKDFVQVLKKGQLVSSRFVALRILFRSATVNRFGVLTSARIFRKASLRNKIKRRLRETLRRVGVGLRPGHDLILIARPGIDRQPLNSIVDTTRSLLTTTHLLKDHHDR